MTAFPGGCSQKDQLLRECLLTQRYFHKEADLGIPQRLLNTISDFGTGLRPGNMWPYRFFYAIQPGADTSGVWPDFVDYAIRTRPALAEYHDTHMLTIGLALALSDNTVLYSHYLAWETVAWKLLNLINAHYAPL